MDASVFRLINQPSPRLRLNHKLRVTGSIGMSSMNTQAVQTNAVEPHSIQQLEHEIAQLRAALRGSEDQWRATFEQAVVGMAHMSLEGHWLRLNQRLCAMLGYRAEELVHKTVEDVTHPDDWAREAAAIAQLRAGTLQSFVTEKRYCHQNGSIIWGRLTLSLVRTADGAPDYFLAVLEDISILRQTAEALRTSEAHYRRIVEDQTDLICRFQPDFRLTFVNPAYAAMAGKAPAELIGVRILDLIPAEYQAQVVQQVSAQYPTGSAARSENPILLPDGSLRWFEWTDRAIVDEQGVVVEYQAVGRDVTARRQAEAAERRQRQFAEALLDSLAALTTSLDVDEVMTQILASAATVVPSDAGSILLFENGYGRVAYSRGFSPEVTTFLQQNRFAVAPLLNIQKALAAKAPYMVLDTQTADDWLAFPFTNWIRSSIGVPIERAGEMIGLLVADSATPHYFQPADVEKLKAFARYASLALTNAYHAALLEAQVTARTLELQAAKEQVEAILDHSQDGIALVQPDLTILQNNPAFGALFQCAEVAQRGRSLLTFIHPADVAQVKAELVQSCRQGHAAYLEARACCADGSAFDMELSIGAIKEKGLVCTLRNISERKARERQLRYYASLQENIGEAVLTTDLQGVIQSWNKAAEMIYGWSAAEVIGKDSQALLQTRYLRATGHEDVWRALIAEGRWQEEVIHQHRDGRDRYLLASLSLLWDAQGQAFGLVAINRDITEYKATAAALAESRHFAAQVTEVAPNNIYIYDLEEQRNIYSNRNIAALLGYSAEEVKALGPQFIAEVMHPDDHARFAAHVAALHKTPPDEAAVFVYRMRHKDGAWRWIESHDTIFRRNAAGQASQLLGVAMDITARKEAEAALEASRHFAERIADMAPNIIYVYDFQAQRNVYLNRNIMTLLGYTIDEFCTIIPHALHEVMHPADAARFPEHIQHLLAGTDGQLFTFEHRMRHKDGRWRWFLGQDTIFQRAADGTVTQFLGITTDITERKEAAEILREQRDFLQLIIDQVPALISVKNPAGRYQLVNQRGAALFGLTAADMVGKSDAELNPNPAEVAFFRQKDQEVLSGGEPIFIPEQPIMGNYYQTSKIPLRNEAGVIDRLLLVSIDISERKRTEAALQQALQVEKELSALKSGFITTTSHEFRTPLAAILALTETLSAYRHKLSDAQIDDRLVKIRQQVEHLTDLMADVLELARIQARVRFTPAAFDPALFCRNLLAEFQNLFGVRHPLCYEGAESLPLVELDQRLLRQIVTNLLSNAVKYSPVEQPVTLTLTYTDALLILQVKDRGIGIPAADLPHLFQPFQRAGNVGAIAGTGLGLAITKEAVELHGGAITVTSTLGAGTTFVVRLPVVRRNGA